MDLSVTCIFVRNNCSTEAQDDNSLFTSGKPQHLLIAVDPDKESISDVTLQVLTTLNLPRQKYSANFVFAGQTVSENAVLSSLQLGPSTKIHCIVSENVNIQTKLSTDQSKNSNEQLNGARLPSSLRSLFYVYCKQPCQAMRTGKLRVRCSNCLSGAVLLKREPQSWNDVTKPNIIEADCAQNKCQNAFAEFYFRCSACSQTSSDSVSTPLPQLRTNHQSIECAICDETMNPIIDFLCQNGDETTVGESCVLCVDCFKTYAQTSLADRTFQLHATSGYTLRCATPNCNGLVIDSHLFRIMGNDFYENYQKQATEAVLMESRGLYCPRPACAYAFMLADQSIIDGNRSVNVTDYYSIDRLIVCPECGHPFCQRCRLSSEDCDCEETTEAAKIEATRSSSSGSSVEGTSQMRRKRISSQSRDMAQLSLTTIRSTTKPCPRCRANTERNGGCMHMTCRFSQCSFQWCWLCEHEWTDECQWDHWFE